MQAGHPSPPDATDTANGVTRPPTLMGFGCAGGSPSGGDSGGLTGGGSPSGGGASSGPGGGVVGSRPGVAGSLFGGSGVICAFRGGATEYSSRSPVGEIVGMAHSK